MIGACAKPTPMIRSKLRSANARIAGSMAFGVPGSMSRNTIGRSFAARCTPCHAAAWQGVQRAAKDLPIVLRDIEPGTPNAIEPAMRAFAERNFDLIIGVGFAQAPIMEQVAKDYPNINFAIIDGVSELPNVASLVFKEHEGSYLVGILAAKASKTGTIGFLGGMDIGLIHRFAKGYEQGAKSVNPNIRVIENYVGVTDSAWNNPGKGD